MSSAMQMRQGSGAGRALAAAGVVGATLASLSSQPAQGYYAAIANSPTAGKHGFSFKFRSLEDAERRALAECRARAKTNDCALVITFGGFRELCAGLAIVQLNLVGKPGTYSMHWSDTGPTHETANAASLKKCKANNFTEELRDLCRVVVTVCSDGR